MKMCFCPTGHSILEKEDEQHLRTCAATFLDIDKEEVEQKRKIEKSTSVECFIHETRALMMT